MTRNFQGNWQAFSKMGISRCNGVFSDVNFPKIFGNPKIWKFGRKFPKIFGSLKIWKLTKYFQKYTWLHRPSLNLQISQGFWLEFPEKGHIIWKVVSQNFDRALFQKIWTDPIGITVFVTHLGHTLLAVFHEECLIRPPDRWWGP